MDTGTSALDLIYSNIFYLFDLSVDFKAMLLMMDHWSTVALNILSNKNEKCNTAVAVNLTSLKITVQNYIKFT